jgi:hypothetical protein
MFPLIAQSECIAVVAKMAHEYFYPCNLGSRQISAEHVKTDLAGAGG